AMSQTTRTSDPELPQEVLDRLPTLDEDALSRFYEAFFDRIYAFVRRMVRKDHLAEDLTQDIFLHLHKAFPSYDPTRALAPWVFTIATNKVRDYWRSRSHQTVQREITIDEEERQHWAVSKLPTPTRSLENKELSEQIAAAVDELPEGMRTTLILRYFEQMSFEAIGRIVDRNETAVRKRYSRALEELRKRLGGTLGLPGGGVA
ncbi:MAG: RNA polymerase sigma factor, partial [Planctomycetes bacterium]|nr:RNA polymerase sigma factor [Planctomycetota bacterium]